MSERKISTTGLIGCLLAAALVPLALPATPAGATGSYAGETLRLVQQGPSVEGHETNWVASGKQTDVSDYAGGFLLEVFAKETSVDPTCSPSYLGEQQALIGDLHERHIVFGLWQGPKTTFSVPFKYVFPGPGQVTLCAYSVFITDTAASASLLVNVAGPSTPVTTVPVSPMAIKPVNTALPAIKRSGKTLSCNRGSWRNAISFAFAWLVNGKPRPGVTDETLAVTGTLKGHNVVCQVTAYNYALKTTASSPSFIVH
jgi:hypothetical protein